MSKSQTTERSVIGVTPITGERIHMDGPWPNYYTRYSANSWTMTMGESDEQVYGYDDLEEAYQSWKSKQ